MNVPGDEKRHGWGSRGLWLLVHAPAVITVVGSAVLAMAVNVADFTEIQALQAVLALLALIGASLLTERLVEGRNLRGKLGDIDTRLSEVLEYARDIETVGLDKLIARRRDLPSLEERLDGAKRVAISGGSLFRLMNEYQSLFEELAERGCKLRFLVTDPESAAAEFFNSVVAYESRDLEANRAQLRLSVADLLALAGRYPGVCEVKLCSVPPPFSIVQVEKGNDSSLIQVEIYPYKVPARDRPTLVLDKKHDPRLHAFFAAQFEGLWNGIHASNVASPVLSAGD